MIKYSVIFENPIQGLFLEYNGKTGKSPIIYDPGASASASRVSIKDLRPNQVPNSLGTYHQKAELLYPIRIEVVGKAK